MNTDGLENMFNQLQGHFDQNEPHEGHAQRFFNKLQQQQMVTNKKSNKLVWLRPLSIAASIVFVIGIGFSILKSSNTLTNELPVEVVQTENYFSNLIAQQVEEINKLQTPENKLLIDDAMQQLKQLENDYLLLEKQLENQGNTKFILSAMITNFQTRINLLQDVLLNIEELEQLKSENNEEYTI